MGVGVGCMGTSVDVGMWGEGVCGCGGGLGWWWVCRCVLFVREDCVCVVSHVFVVRGRLCAIIE